MPLYHLACSDWLIINLKLQQLINPRGETPRGPPPSSAPPPWATSGPKPLMSTPVPPPGNLGPPPPSGAPPWANKPGLLGPGGPPMGGRPPHGPGLAGELIQTTVKSHFKALGLYNFKRSFGWAYKRGGLYLGGLISGIKKCLGTMR